MEKTSIKNTPLCSSYKIIRFVNSTDRDFIKALKLYNDITPVEMKTDTNEITFFIDTPDNKKREMYFFGLYYNGDIIGYIESAYLKTTKIIMIDYISMKNEYRINGVFYPLFSLFQQYFSDNLINYDYIVFEVSMRSLAENVDDESYYTRKLLQFEDFRIIDTPYPQPKLGIQNLESNFDLKLMIKSTHCISSLKSETLLNIIEDIYTNHYYNWYSKFLNSKEIEEYKEHLKKQYLLVKQRIGDESEIHINELPIGACEYFLSEQCHYKHETVSTAGFIKGKSIKSKRFLLLIGIPIIIAFSILVSCIGYIILNKLKISLEVISPLISAIMSSIIGILTLILTNSSKQL